jgi:hypothetical protein
MWLEAIISQDDLASLAVELLPLSVHLGQPDSEHYVLLSAATEVELVEGRGLRIRCNAQIRWPVLGMDIPINVDGLTVLVEPSVPADNESLVFSVEVERANVAWVPSVLDAKIVDAINEALRKKSRDLSWNFMKTLSHEFLLPEVLQPLHALGLKAAWGTVRTTEDAMVLAVSFKALAIRDDELGRARHEAITTNGAHAPLRLSEPPRHIGRASSVSVAIATALALTTTYFTLLGVYRLFAGLGSRTSHRRAVW